MRENRPGSRSPAAFRDHLSDIIENPHDWWAYSTNAKISNNILSDSVCDERFESSTSVPRITLLNIKSGDTRNFYIKRDYDYLINNNVEIKNIEYTPGGLKILDNQPEYFMLDAYNLGFILNISDKDVKFITVDDLESYRTKANLLGMNELHRGNKEQKWIIGKEQSILDYSHISIFESNYESLVVSDKKWGVLLKYELIENLDFYKSIDFTGVTWLHRDVYIGTVVKYERINELIIGNLDTSKVISFGEAFADLDINKLDISEMTAESAEAAYRMFEDCTIGTLDMRKFVPKNIEILNTAFKGINSLDHVKLNKIFKDEADKLTNLRHTKIDFV